MAPDIGLSAWLFVGIALFLVGSVWLLSLTEVIVGPVIAATVIAAVTPLVAWLQRHHVPRPAGAILLVVAIILLGAAVVVVVLAGITTELGGIKGHLADAKNTIEGWLKDLGVNPGTADSAKQDASSSSTDAVEALLKGIGGGLAKLSSLVFFRR